MAGTGWGAADAAVLVVYLLLLTVSGIVLARRRTSARDYFLASGQIPVWAAAISFLATALSAATFIGGPEQAFAGDLSYLSANLGSLLAVVIVALFFVPVFYRYKVATVYELLGRRYGPAAAQAAGGAFLLGRLFASSARLYIAALPLALMVFGDLTWPHQLAAIAALTVIGSVYTLTGGIRSVIWTDVVQTTVFVGAAVAAFFLLLHRIPLSLPEIATALAAPAPGQASKLTVFKWGFDGFGPQHQYTVLTAVFGFTLLNLGAYGTDQDLAQRLLTCRSAAKGSWSAILAILIGLPVTLLFMGLGLLLYIFYARPDLMGAAAPAYAVQGRKDVFLRFILREMPPGMCGLMLAGLFAVCLGSLVSALNAMSSSIVNDFYKRLRPGFSDAQYLRAGRLGVLGSGLLLGLFATGCLFWQSAQPRTRLIDFALSVMVFAYSGLVAVFLAALFTRRGSSASVIAALLTGFGAVAVMQIFLAPTLAFPWQMVIATALAFLVCCLGRAPQRVAEPAHDWGLEIGDWRLGFGSPSPLTAPRLVLSRNSEQRPSHPTDLPSAPVLVCQSPIPNPQSPIPNVQSPIPNPQSPIEVTPGG